LKNSKADPNTSNLASEMQEKRKEIRLLFQQCETAMQREKDLENKFRDLEMQHRLHPNADKHVTRTSYPNLQGPSIASHTFSNHPQAVANTEAIRRLEMYGSASSDNDTTTTDDEGESLTVKELERCARQIQRLLHRIKNVQDGISGGCVVKHSRKRRMYKSYQRFCRKFEQNLGNSRPNQSVPKTSIDDDQRNVSPSHIHADFRNMAEAPATARNPEPFISNSMQDSVTHEIATAVHPHHSNRMQWRDTPVSFVARTSALRPAKRFRRASMSMNKKDLVKAVKSHNEPSPSFAFLGSHNSQPEGLEEGAAAPYGTRSRNRPGRSRINYTENTDEDFNMAAPALTNGNLPDSPLQPSVTAEATQSVTVNLEDQGFSSTDDIEERKDDRDEIFNPGVCSEQSQQDHRTVPDGALYQWSLESQEHSVPITVSMKHDKFTEAEREIETNEGTKCGHPGCGKVFYRQELLKRHEKRQ
jgi:hypothetical protein